MFEARLGEREHDADQPDERRDAPARRTRLSVSTRLACSRGKRRPWLRNRPTKPVMQPPEDHVQHERGHEDAGHHDDRAQPCRDLVWEGELGHRPASMSGRNPLRARPPDDAKRRAGDDAARSARVVSLPMPTTADAHRHDRLRVHRERPQLGAVGGAQGRAVRRADHRRLRRGSGASAQAREAERRARSSSSTRCSTPSTPSTCARRRPNTCPSSKAAAEREAADLLREAARARPADGATAWGPGWTASRTRSAS